MALRPNLFVTVYTNTLYFLCSCSSSQESWVIFVQTLKYFWLITLHFTVFTSGWRMRCRRSRRQSVAARDFTLLIINLDMSSLHWDCVGSSSCGNTWHAAIISPHHHHTTQLCCTSSFVSHSSFSKFKRCRHVLFKIFFQKSIYSILFYYLLLSRLHFAELATIIVDIEYI